MQFSVSNIVSSLILLTILLSLGCTATKQAADDREDPARDVSQDTTRADAQNLTSLQTTLANTRSKLSDVYTSQKHDMPDFLQKQDSSDESINSNPFDGYRIQIISTRDQPLADSVANKFRAWSDSTISGYTAKAYVFFRQPYYKVHIGDFQERDSANRFFQLIKRKYPDAWVVHDRINPANVPADTTTFSFITPEERKDSNAKQEDTANQK